MPLHNTSNRYGAVSKVFHWLTALLILTEIPLGLIANGMAQDLNTPGIVSTQADIQRTALLFSIHKTTGVLIFFVALARILWAVTQDKPAPLHPERRLETFLAETVHWLLYGSLVLVPLTGWIHHAATVGFAPIWWPFGQSLPLVPKDETVSHLFATLHVIFIRVLLVSIALHVAGAIKHQIIDRDATLRRMWFGGNGTDRPAKPAPHTALPAVAALLVWAAALGFAALSGVFASESTASEPTAAASESASAPADPADTASAGWQVDEGTLNITITQMGSTVTGTFADWTADIIFEEPAAPGPAGTVDVTIAIPSLTLGGVTQQAMGPDFFDAENFPTARFEAEIEKTPDGYVATGTLTIRDTTLPVTLPFDLTVQDDTATMTGTLQLQRLDYQIGQSVTDPASLGLDVDVDVALTATRKEQ